MNMLLASMSYWEKDTQLHFWDQKTLKFQKKLALDNASKLWVVVLSQDILKQSVIAYLPWMDLKGIKTTDTSPTDCLKKLNHPW
jgi:hypothetical protein